jgi:hypothetical protein
MAELDPEVVGRTGIDPVTGSILSQDVRNALMKRASINSSIMREENIRIERQRAEVDSQNIAAAQGNQLALVELNSNIESLRNEITKLGTGLAGISVLLQQDSLSEENRIRAQQERDRRLAEQEIRIGKENESEQKIQNSILEPVEKLTPKVSNIFSSIGTALSALFLGWIAKETIDLLDINQKEGVDKVNDIKGNVLKNVGILVGGLVAIKAGFGLIMKTIGTIGSFLTKLFITKPLSAALNLMPGRKPKGGGAVGGGITKGITVISGLMNFFNNENVDGLLAVASLLGPFKFVRMAAGAGFIADEIAEAFGSNIFENNKVADDIVNAAKNLTKETTNKAASLLGMNNADKVPNKESSSANMTSSPSVVPVTPMMNTDTNNLTTQASDSAQNTQSPEVTSSATMIPTAVVSPPKPESSSPIMPAQVMAPPKQQQNVGSLPDPKPSVILMSTINQNRNQESLPVTSGALSDVPLINPANPDNFYVLYSQLNYNVVM